MRKGSSRNLGRKETGHELSSMSFVVQYNKNLMRYAIKNSGKRELRKAVDTHQKSQL